MARFYRVDCTLVIRLGKYLCLLNRTILEVGVQRWIRQDTRPLARRLSDLSTD